MPGLVPGSLGRENLTRVLRRRRGYGAGLDAGDRQGNALLRHGSGQWSVEYPEDCSRGEQQLVPDAGFGVEEGHGARELAQSGSARNPAASRRAGHELNIEGHRGAEAPGLSDHGMAEWSKNRNGLQISQLVGVG